MRKLLVANNLLLPLLLLVLVMLPSLVGLLHPGFFVSDDGNWMVIRFSAFYEALRSGQFPVRFLPRLLNGYGYPVADFLYPLFMYLGVPIHIVGISFVNTIKILFGLSLVFSGVFSFLWLKRVFTPLAAFFGAIAYVYFPYHLLDTYKRGSLGEILALAIVPFILWQIERKQSVWIGLGIGLLILSHNTLALVFLPIILGYYFLRQRNRKDIIVAALWGFGFAAFFWIPALFDKQYTVFDSKTVSGVDQFFLGSSSYYYLGFISILAGLAGMWGVYKKNTLAVFFAGVFLLSLIFALPISKILWNILPLGKYVQFPFRFLSLTTLATSFLLAYVLSVVGKKYKTVLLVVSALCIIVSALPALLPTSYQMYPDTWYSTNQDSTTVQNEYLPIWVTQVPTTKTSVASILKGNGTINSAIEKGSKIFIQTNSSENTLLQINTIYFPGWKIVVDTKRTPITYTNPQGLMQIHLTPGQHSITASYTESTVSLFADGISILTILFFIGYGWMRMKHI